MKKIVTSQELKEIARRLCYISFDARNERKPQNKKCLNCIVNSMGTFKT